MQTLKLNTWHGMKNPELFIATGFFFLAGSKVKVAGKLSFVSSQLVFQLHYALN